MNDQPTDGVTPNLRPIRERNKPLRYAQIPSAHRVLLPLEFKPVDSMGDLLLQHLEALEREAEEKGAAQQVLAEQFAKVYKVSLPLAA